MGKDDKKSLQDTVKKEVKVEEQPKVSNAQAVAKEVPPHAFYRG